jgi:general transcription factor 3C polypeptide 3 (transcription factor C subunit 4)
LFLDYAVGLAMAGRREEAYQVCAAARDSNAFQSSEHNFAVHVAWSGENLIIFALNRKDY